MATILQKNGVKSLSNGHNLSGTNHQNAVNDLTKTTDRQAVNVTSSEREEVNQIIAEENEKQLDENQEPEIDIVINNVVCSFSVRCHLNLREIALNGTNVEYRKENGMITMKMRRPYSTASIWSSGKVTCTGATSEVQAKISARRVARSLQKLGFNVRFNNYRVVNVLGTCSMPFGIKITSFSERHKEADYEPELHPGVTYKLKQPKATLKIFSTGSVTVTAPCVLDVQSAIELIFPLVYEFRKKRTPDEISAIKKRRLALANAVQYDSPPENEEAIAGGGAAGTVEAEFEKNDNSNDL